MLRKILIVDDSALMQQMYRLALARYAEARLFSALNGAEALEVLAREADVDLVLLDLNMPIMTGLEMLDQMRTQARYARIPVIVVTSQSDTADRQRCLKLGARACLAKPFATPELCRLIEELTRGEPGDRPA
jgi:CheY-like chemotaxis protein